jgi:hypothetical protein
MQASGAVGGVASSIINSELTMVGDEQAIASSPGIAMAQADTQVRGPFPSGFEDFAIYEILGTPFVLPSRYVPIRGIGVGAYGVVWYGLIQPLL